MPVIFFIFLAGFIVISRPTATKSMTSKVEDISSFQFFWVAANRRKTTAATTTNSMDSIESSIRSYLEPPGNNADS